MSGKQLLRRREGKEGALSGREHPDGTRAFPSRRDASAPRSGTPAEQAHREALARWPLMAEIDRVLSRQDADPSTSGAA